MNKSHVLILLALSALMLGQVDDAAGQRGSLKDRLASATRLDCAFSTLVTGDWEDAGANAVVGETDLELSFVNVNIDEGTADAEGLFGASFIVVRQSSEYLHLMQMFNAGPLYVTTVMAQETADGRMMATHTRHEYTPIKLIGYTSRPEMYVGACAVQE